VVSRGIFTEMALNDEPCMYLDIKSILSAAQIIDKFPTIYNYCLKFDVDITKQLIPVTPAAHYSCGGIWVDMCGKTDIDNLYAVGEVACTGLHGANRLASTSLLEGLVWGLESARDISKNESKLIDQLSIPPWQTDNNNFADEVLIQHDINRIQSIMWNYVGVSRSPERLMRALRELRNLETDIEAFYRTNKVSDALIGLRNTVRTSIITTLAAWSNKTSIGCHYREDDKPKLFNR
jgi:L-aspartate oxidase